MYVPTTFKWLWLFNILVALEKKNIKLKSETLKHNDMCTEVDKYAELCT